MRQIPLAREVTTPGELALYYPNYVTPRIQIRLPGFIYPEDIIWQFRQVSVETLSGKIKAYGMPLVTGRATLRLRGITTTLRNQLSVFYNTVNGMQKSWQFRMPHRPDYFTAQFATPEFALALVSPGMWEWDAEIIITGATLGGIRPDPEVVPVPIPVKRE